MNNNIEQEVNRWMIKDGKVTQGRLNNAIQAAAEAGDLESVKFLFENGAKTLKRALFWASENGALDVVKYLIDQGVRVENYALVLASMSGYVDVMKVLVEHGADPHVCSFYNAAEHGDVEQIEFLLSFDIREFDIDLALYHSVENNQLECVTYLLLNGAKFTYDVVSRSIFANAQDVTKYLMNYVTDDMLYSLNLPDAIYNEEVKLREKINTQKIYVLAEIFCSPDFFGNNSKFHGDNIREGLELCKMINEK